MAKPLEWTGDSWKKLKEFPPQVQRDCGYALHLVQIGDVPSQAKPLKGVGGGAATVMEIVLDHNRDTYRAIYTTKLKGVVYVLHCFQKKSRKGISTPRQEIATIERNLKVARQKHHLYWEEVS